MFVSVDGKAKEVKEIFAGGSDGKAHKITEAFGGVDGVAKRMYTSEKETNAFDEFTWAEIKQLANEGKLLEHFNKYDRVTIKLTDLLQREYTYINNEEEWCKFTAKQDKLILQITDLTETSMRLSSPYATVLSKSIATGVYTNNGFAPWTVSTTTTAPFEEGSSITVTTTNYENSFYWMINDVLPEDIKAVAKGYEMIRETVAYSSGGKADTKDLCYVRNISEPINFVVTQNKDTLPYTYEITETQFPRKQSGYMYHIKTPEDFQKFLNSGTRYQGGCGRGRTFLYSTGSSDTKRQYFYSDAPEVSYSWTDKYTRPDGSIKILRSYYYANQQKLPEHFSGSESWDYIPEISIEADV